jgi:multiple sugar transport system substrate-binding protein
MCKRLYQLILWAIVLFISLSGCGLTMATPKPEPITLIFAFPEVDQAFYELMAQKFHESQPNVTFDLRPQHDGRDDLIEPDKMDSWVVTPSAISQLQEQSQILSLEPFIEQDQSFKGDDFQPGVFQLFMANGKTWAIPTGLDIVVMYYNQDLFDQAGVVYPQAGWTWTEFLAAAQSLRNDQTGVFGYGPMSYDSDRNMMDVLHFIYQHGGRVVDNLQNPTQTTFDDPLTIEAVEWFNALINEYNVAPTPEQVRKFGAARYGIYQGIMGNKIAMWMGSFSERGGKFYWPTEWEMRWGMVPLPRGAQAMTQVMANGYVISAKAKNPEVCWQWLKFLSQQLPEREIPARPSLLASNAYEKKMGKELAGVVRAALKDAALVSPRIDRFGDAFLIFSRAVTDIINQKSIPADALIRAQREALSKMGQQ